jgi:hypothetical protein
MFRKKPKENETQNNKPEFTNPLGNLISMNSSDNRNMIDGQRMIQEWLSAKHITRKTNLSQNQINQICILMSLAKQFKIHPLKDLIMNFLTLMISKESASANQLVAILQSRGLMEKSDLDLIGKFSK